MMMGSTGVSSSPVPRRDLVVVDLLWWQVCPLREVEEWLRRSCYGLVFLLHLLCFPSLIIVPYDDACVHNLIDCS